jgi:hypothetical protein
MPVTTLLVSINPILMLFAFDTIQKKQKKENTNNLIEDLEASS